jgi:hypothetical protein
MDSPYPRWYMVVRRGSETLFNNTKLGKLWVLMDYDCCGCGIVSEMDRRLGGYP